MGSWLEKAERQGKKKENDPTLPDPPMAIPCNNGRAKCFRVGLVVEVRDQHAGHTTCNEGSHCTIPRCIFAQIQKGCERQIVAMNKTLTINVPERIKAQSRKYPWWGTYQELSGYTVRS